MHSGGLGKIIGQRSSGLLSVGKVQGSGVGGMSRHFGWRPRGVVRCEERGEEILIYLRKEEREPRSGR